MKNKSIVFFNITSFFQLFFIILKIFSAIFFVPCAKSFTYDSFAFDFSNFPWFLDHFRNFLLDIIKSDCASEID